MTNRIFIPSMIFGLVLLTAIFAQAMNEPDFTAGCAGDESALNFGEGRHGERKGHRLEMMATILDLSSAQQEQIEQIYTAEREAHKDARHEMRAERKALNDLMHAQPLDETALRSLARQQADKRIDMMVDRAKIKQQIFAILSPDQQKKAEELWTLMGKGRQGRGMKR